MNLLDGQEIRVGWHPSLPSRLFTCPKCGAERYMLSYVRGEWGCRGKGCHALDYQCRHLRRSIWATGLPDSFAGTSAPRLSLARRCR
jgi:hypothetical protein